MSFLRLNNIPLHAFSTFYLGFIHQWALELLFLVFVFLLFFFFLTVHSCLQGKPSGHVVFSSHLCVSSFIHPTNLC